MAAKNWLTMQGNKNLARPSLCRLGFAAGWKGGIATLL